MMIYYNIIVMALNFCKTCKLGFSHLIFHELGYQSLNTGKHLHDYIFTNEHFSQNL